MKRTVAFTGVIVMILTMCLWTLDAWARAGGGKSTGSRGSRSSSSPANPEVSPSSSTRQTAPPSAAQQAVPQRSWMGGLMGGIMGFAIGGAIGSLLFGGMGGSLFGGIGLLEILLIGGLVYFVFSYMRRRQQPALAAPSGYAPPQGMEAPSWSSESRSMPMATLEATGTESDLARGLRHIRQIDNTFTPERFVETASDIFFKVQAAWTARDLSAIGDLLTPEIHATLQQEGDRLRTERRINHIENMAVRSVQVTEAWQEVGQDFVTVHIRANVLDYTVDESSGQVLMGSRTEPIQFAEYWTFVRPVGPNAWKLSAIQQAV
jgi:predicted lipid-binding transport protein (Tim44 family)